MIGIGEVIDLFRLPNAQSFTVVADGETIARRLDLFRECQRIADAEVHRGRQALLQDARQWRVILSDTFDDNHLEWTTGEQDDPELATMSWSIERGKYRWQGSAKNGFVWWVTPESEAYTDFYLTASILQTSQPGVGEYGLIFRQITGEDYFLFELNGSGEYALFLHWSDGWEPLIDWTPHPAINAGSQNRLEVIARGADFIFMINDANVASYSDERFAEGAVGLLAGLSNPGETAIWEFDDFILRAP